MRALAQIARTVTETPWLLDASALAAARAAGLGEEAILQAILLSAFFGHLNRMADAIGIALDYHVAQTPPHAEPATPAYLPAPFSDAAQRDSASRSDLDAVRRTGATEALLAWREYALLRDAPLDRRQRTLIAQAVAERLGDRAIARAESPRSALDAALIATADEVTLAPWRLGAATVARLRAAGLADDAAIFDAIATASGCTTFSRIRVALRAFA